MRSPIADRLRDAVSQGRWDEAVALLQTNDTVHGAAALSELPFDRQQSLFRNLPLDLAAAVVAHFPYYHQYVLLHSLPAEEMRKLVDKISPDDRMRFFDELPEEAWQRLQGSSNQRQRVHHKQSRKRREKLSSKAGRLKSVTRNRMAGKFRSSLPWIYPSNPAPFALCLGLLDQASRLC
jgi:Mg/Co/Ni transporter MgtE